MISPAPVTYLLLKEYTDHSRAQTQHIMRVTMVKIPFVDINGNQFRVFCTFTLKQSIRVSVGFCSLSFCQSLLSYGGCHWSALTN